MVCDDRYYQLSNITVISNLNSYNENRATVKAYRIRFWVMCMIAHVCFDHVIKDHGNLSTDTIVKTHKVAIKNLISEAWIHDLVFAYYSLYIFHYHTEQPMGSVVILYNFELCSFLHCILYQSVVIVLLCCALEKTVFAIIILSHNLIIRLALHWYWHNLLFHSTKWFHR